MMVFFLNEVYSLAWTGSFATAARHLSFTKAGQNAR